MVKPIPTLRDAENYVRIVQDTFKDKPETYKALFEVLANFQSQRIGYDGVRSTVEQLFTDHRELLWGFNQFLPEAYEIILESDIEEAFCFLRKFEARLGGDDHACKIFLDALIMYMHYGKSIDEFYDEVTILFRDHQDLFEEFQRILPPY